MKEMDTAYKSVPVAPDGGWGWVVLIGSFVAFFLDDGWSYSFGVLFPELLENFGESKGKTSLIAALLYGMPLLLSPIACALTTCYGCRIVMIIGGFFVALSIFLSSFATSVNFLCATVGVLSSIGLTLTYIPSLIIVTFYFEKRRGLATGLAVTGSGLGAILFPPFMEYLCNVYTWRGFLMITGGLCLHIMASGFLFRPPPMSKEAIGNDGEEMKLLTESGSEGLTAQKTKSGSCMEFQVEMLGSGLSLHAPGRSNGAVLIEMDTMYNKPKSTSCPELQNLEDSPEDARMKQVKIQPEPKPEKRPSHLELFWKELRTIAVTMVDKSFAKNGAFVLFCGANFLLYLWVGVPYIFLIDRAIGLQISTTTHIIFLSSIIGIGRTVGQIIMGYLGDHPKINCNVLYGAAITVIGVDTLLVPLCNSYWSLCVFSAVYGFFVSVTYAIQMMCVVDIVGLEHATNAFGALQMLQGIATILGTPLAGWLFDVSGGYDPTFYTSGAWMALSGLMILPLPWVIKNRTI